ADATARLLVLRPLLHLVEVTVVGEERIVGLFGGPIDHGALWLLRKARAARTHRRTGRCSSATNGSMRRAERMNSTMTTMPQSTNSPSSRRAPIVPAPTEWRSPSCRRTQRRTLRHR